MRIFTKISNLLSPDSRPISKHLLLLDIHSKFQKLSHSVYWNKQNTISSSFTDQFPLIHNKLFWEPPEWHAEIL